MTSAFPLASEEKGKNKDKKSLYLFKYFRSKKHGGCQKKATGGGCQKKATGVEGWKYTYQSHLDCLKDYLASVQRLGMHS